MALSHYFFLVNYNAIVPHPFICAVLTLSLSKSAFNKCWPSLVKFSVLLLFMLPTDSPSNCIFVFAFDWNTALQLKMLQAWLFNTTL